MNTEPAGVGEAEAAPSTLISLGFPAATHITHFKEEDDDDVHKCGRCQAEFTSLEEFVHHKIQKICQKPQGPSLSSTVAAASQEVVPSIEDSVTVSHVIVETSPIPEEISNAPDLVSENMKGILTSEECVLGNERRDVEELEVEWHESREELVQESPSEIALVKMVLDERGRYICQLCEKTFKTANILKAHMVTHSSKKEFVCTLCGNAFRTKGSLIRHNRRHTDERPYICSKCGKSFRESGALTRHMKSITPCTEKIRLNMEKELLITREEYSSEEVVTSEDAYNKMSDTSSQLASDDMDGSPVIRLVTDAKGNILHEVHVQVQSLAIQTTSQAAAGEQCAGDGELSCDRFLHQTMSSSGIVIETVAMQDVESEDRCIILSKELQNGELKLQVHEQDTTDGTVGNEDENFSCPHCGENCHSSNGLKVHLKGHEGCKLYRCMVCNRDFLKAHLLRKHQESHCDDRKYKCGECGKTYKTVAHVKGHMRVHSDDRPYPCSKCGKRYKTKNAQQVHFRTHLADKPYTCHFCTNSFREKGSLVRHIRHHTGEKPFKCHKCGRGFAEHGTLNRHLRTKGGCMLTLNMNKADDSSTAIDSTNSDTMDAPVSSEESHTVLVEFSSVVADTQEYIIEATEDLETSEATELIQGTETHEVDSHILEVVQQIVSTASPGQQIIVQNVTLDESSDTAMEEVSTADTITIATPESLTEQVAMTLASAIVEHPVLENDLPTEEKEDVVAEDVEMVEQVAEFVITSHDGELEVQTVIV
ncbi:transcription factor E4F1 [Pelobates cultripes]|uniref:Transcription factor E4F1 n=1 Tax=Pelobates cultripes TaxID=61616 RepID=A0AAD1SQ09_PELCU|nr:transcription factor E4F1 [Pelobates cultripes]